MANVATELTDRQRALLRGVVEEHIATGQPVGSKTLVERTGLRVSPSTVRAKLAELEGLGLLTHPHTSAGRVPTEAAYRSYAAGLLERLEPNPGPFPLDLSAAQAEVESALQATTEMLSAVTRLLALVSAPPLESATIRHVEVLLLQPQVVMLVVITSAGVFSARSRPKIGSARMVASPPTTKPAGIDRSCDRKPRPVCPPTLPKLPMRESNDTSVARSEVGMEWWR